MRRKGFWGLVALFMVVSLTVPSVSLAESDPPATLPITKCPIAAGWSFTLAIAENGNVYAWGNNTQGQLGIGLHGGNWGVFTEGIDRSTPTEIPALADVIAVAAGGHHSLFLKSDGTVWG